jgi:hypothetical protein
MLLPRSALLDQLQLLFNYTLIAMGNLASLAKIITNGILSQDEDGDQIYDLLSSVLLGTWNDVPAASTWSGYSATETWLQAVNLGLGEIDQPGLYVMENRDSSPDTIYNIASNIAKLGFGYLYEDNQGNIGYADADHRQTYLSEMVIPRFQLIMHLLKASEHLFDQATFVMIFILIMATILDLKKRLQVLLQLVFMDTSQKLLTQLFTMPQMLKRLQIDTSHLDPFLILYLTA